MAAGTLTLCSMAELSKILNSENASNLLEQTQGLSKRKTEALVAQQLPLAKVARESMRTVAVSKPLSPVKAPCTGSPLCVRPLADRFLFPIERQEANGSIV